MGTDDDALIPWSARAARVMRPSSVKDIRQLFMISALLVGALAVAGVGVVPFISDATQGQRAGENLTAVVAVLLAAFYLAAAIGFSERTLGSWGVAVAVVCATAPSLLISSAVIAAGPHGMALAVMFPLANLYTYGMLRPVAASVVMALTPFECAFALYRAEGSSTDRFLVWFFASAGTVAASLAYALLVGRVQRLLEAAESAQSELARSNSELERRVAEQVDELRKAEKFRRFLPPRVAEVVASGQDHVLAPHRRKIAVVFCDLRGFTAFTNAHEPEEVVGVLDEYVGSVGQVLARHGATLGSYAGDGIMAFFGDPLPSEDPAADALAMSADLRAALDRLIARWRGDGFDLGYGVGMAQGYATLGVVGTDGRFDYTPLGSVVNLAARLCARAEHGQFLADHAIHRAAGDGGRSEPLGTVALKGFAEEVPVYLLRA